MAGQITGKVQRDPEFFAERELKLVYIAKRLKESLRLEDLLTSAGVDYAVEPDKYLAGLIFRGERIGAFFYVDEAAVAQTADAMTAGGFHIIKED